MARDRRYSSNAWQQTRKLVILRAGGLCEVRGPKCTIRATQAHHRVPSSQAPERFFDMSNLQASCTACNRHGAVTQAENRNFRMTVAELERLVEEQRVEIERLAAELAHANRPRVPQIR